MAVVIKSLGVELRDIKTEDLAVICTLVMIELIWRLYMERVLERREDDMGLLETAHKRS